ncbi:helix-turn-helix domain-containing protein [Mucilaginibacter sp. UC70_90]
MDSIGQIIRAKRLSNGQLLRHVAAHLDIDQSILSKIEHDERKPTKNNIIKLAEILKMDAKELIVQYISDKIISEFAYEPCLSEAIEFTAKKVSLIHAKNKI